MRAKDRDGMQEEVAEIGSVQSRESLLIGDVELHPLAVAEGHALARRHLVGREAAVLPTVDEMRELAGRPALLVDVLSRDHLFHQADLVVRIENGEVRPKADQFRVPAQHLGGDRMESAEPRHAFGDLAEQEPHPELHLARRLVGEGDGEDLRRIGACRRDDDGRCASSAPASCRCRRPRARAPARRASPRPRAARGSALRDSAAGLRLPPWRAPRGPRYSRRWLRRRAAKALKWRIASAGRAWPYIRRSTAVRHAANSVSSLKAPLRQGVDEQFS